MAGSTPAPGGRLPLGKAVGQAWALWLAGFLALIGGLVLLVSPGAGLRLVKWVLGLFLLGWGVMRLVHAFSGPRRDRTWLVLSVDRRRDPSWWLQLLRGLGTIALVVALLVWPGETLDVVRIIAAVLLLLWGASTLGEAYQSPIRDDTRGYRGELNKEIPHRLI